MLDRDDRTVAEGITPGVGPFGVGAHNRLLRNTTAAVVHNTIGKNNIGGDPLDGSASDPFTTGILVFSGTVPVQVEIAHNRIRDNQYGIWLGVHGNVTATLSHNVFQDVTTSVFTSP